MCISVWSSYKFFQTLCMKDDRIFVILLEFFFVTEFKSCGSKYCHGLLWVANAPIYGVYSNRAIVNFIDKYIMYDNSKI